MTGERPPPEPVPWGRVATVLLGVFVCSVVVAEVVAIAELGDLVDLEVYRLGGRAVIDGTPLYGVVSSIGLSFTYPPFAAVLFVPLAVLPAAFAGAVLAVGSTAALLRSAWLVARLARGGRPSLLVVLGLTAVVIVSDPGLGTVGYGQVNLLIMWLVLEDLVGAWPARWRGVLVGVATGIKLAPALFVVHLLTVRRWADAARGGAAFAGTVALGFAAAPHQAWTYWTTAAFDVGRVGRYSGVGFVGNQSLHGAVERLLGPDVAVPLWLVPSVVLAVAGLVVAARLARKSRPLAALTAVAVTMLVVSPVSWHHHWVWVLLPAGLAVATTATTLDRVVGCTGVAVLCSRVIWLAPHGQDREYAVHGIALVGQDAYLLVGLAWLAWLATLSRRPNLESDQADRAAATSR